MENASDALIMATDILIFIVALTLCISSFTNVRQGVDNIINRPETIKMAKDSEGYINYIESDKNKATRLVGVETVVPALYRAIKENYVVYIYLKDGVANLSGAIPIDTTKDITININGVNTNVIEKNKKIYMFKVGNPEKTNPYINKLLSDLTKNVYKKLGNTKFYEYLGEYQLDTSTNREDRTTYRIITYIQQ